MTETQSNKRIRHFIVELLCPEAQRGILILAANYKQYHQFILQYGLGISSARYIPRQSELAKGVIISQTEQPNAILVVLDGYMGENFLFVEEVLTLCEERKVKVLTLELFRSELFRAIAGKINPPEREHAFYKCKSDCEGCKFCNGGLSWCLNCNSVEGELASECPGEKVPEALSVLVYARQVDFKNGKWLIRKEDKWVELPEKDRQTIIEQSNS